MATTETPGKVWICPACGNRYDAPTTCSNEHPPTVCEEYDLAPGDTAEQATDAEAALVEQEAPVQSASEPEAPTASPLHDAAAALDAARASLDSAISNLAAHLEVEQAS